MKHFYEDNSQQTDVLISRGIKAEITEDNYCEENNSKQLSENSSKQQNTPELSQLCNLSLNDKIESKHEEHIIENDRLLRQLKG